MAFSRRPRLAEGAHLQRDELVIHRGIFLGSIPDPDLIYDQTI